MIRRAVRLLIDAFCLLSLLAAVAVAWVWWESAHGRGYVAELACARVYLVLGGSPPPDQAGALIACGFPGGPQCRFWSQSEYLRHRVLWRSVQVRPWQRFYLSGLAGRAAVAVDASGEPVRSGRGAVPDRRTAGLSQLMPVWSVDGIPLGAVAALFGMPPVPWAAVRYRRRLTRRRRLRLGLCLVCGYDLRASAGRCPECGATAPAKEAAA